MGPDQFPFLILPTHHLAIPLASVAQTLDCPHSSPELCLIARFSASLTSCSLSIHQSNNPDAKSLIASPQGSIQPGNYSCLRID